MKPLPVDRLIQCLNNWQLGGCVKTSRIKPS
jgi:hypothetical protein